MDTTGLIESLRQDLTRAAEVGGLEVQVAAERLLLALEPALRLTLMEALGQAAGEIAEQLPGVAIDVRLAGREPQLVVSGAPQPAGAESGAPPPDEPADAEDGEAVARITLRIPETLKARAEQLASRRGQSLNTWLVGAARAAATDRPNDDPGRHSHRGRHGRGQRLQGWAK